MLVWMKKAPDVVMWLLSRVWLPLSEKVMSVGLRVWLAVVLQLPAFSAAVLVPSASA